MSDKEVFGEVTDDVLERTAALSGLHTEPSTRAITPSLVGEPGELKSTEEPSEPCCEGAVTASWSSSYGSEEGWHDKFRYFISLSQFCLTSYMQSPMSVLQSDCKSEPRASRAEDCDSWMCLDEADVLTRGSIKLGARSHPLTVLLWRWHPAQEQGGKLEQHPCKLFE